MGINIEMFGGDSPTDNLKRVFADGNLEEEINQYISRQIQGNPDTKLGIIQMDMDKSKEIRSYGIEYKIAIINEINEYLEGAFSNVCMVFSHGTRDDVTLIFKGDTLEPRAVLEQVRKILNSLANEQFAEKLTYGPVKVTYSAGFALYPLHAKNASDLLMLADGAVRRAKDSGRNMVLEAEEGFHYLVSVKIDAIRKMILNELSCTTGKSLQELYREGLEELFEKHSALNRFCILNQEE